MDSRKNFFSEREVKHEKKLSREMLESPSLQVFKIQIDEVLWDVG